MGGIAVGFRRAGTTRTACRPARSSRCCSQFRLQAPQELLSRLRRAAGYFPGMPCYEHFVTLQKSVFVPLVFFLHSHLGTRTGLYSQASPHFWGWERWILTYGILSIAQQRQLCRAI